LAVLALYLSGQGLKNFLLALLLMTCAHGGYQTGIALCSVAMFASIALWLWQDGELKNLRSYIKEKIIPALLVLIAGFFFHKAILFILMKFMRLEEGVRLKSASIPHNLNQFIDNIKLSFNSIPSAFSHQILYFNHQITFIYLLFFILSIYLILNYFYKKPSFNRFALIFLFILFSFMSLMSTFLPTIVTGSGWISNRILFPISVFHSFIVLFVLSSNSIIIRNLSIVGCFLLIFFFSWHNNMYAYRSFIQDRADFELAGRIISRIENLPEYEDVVGKPLKIIRIGTKDIAMPGYRFTATPNIKVRTEGAFSQTWSADGIFRYLHFPYTLIHKNLEDQEISQNMAETILQMKEWPSQKSVAIVDGAALLMLDKGKISNNVFSVLFSKGEKNGEFIILPDSSSLKYFSQISTFSPDGNFVVSGNDPTINFRIPVLNNNHRYIMRVRLDVPSMTIVQLFYKVSSNQNYSEKNSLNCTVDKGSNSCYFMLDGSSFDSEIRLDPGRLPGNYKFRDITVRQIMSSLEKT
jgi:hypothetical protein